MLKPTARGTRPRSLAPRTQSALINAGLRNDHIEAGSASQAEAGRLLLGHASAIESRLRAAEADFRAYAAGTTGSLRVGIYQSVANKILPELMRRFNERWPSVDVQVTEGTRDDDLVDAVERGE